VDYHHPITIEDNVYSFGYLNPFEHIFYSEKAKKQIRVIIKFSNHCFTKACENSNENTQIIKDSGNRDRVFCPIRYQASTQLPTIIQQLLEANAKVWQTQQERNWVHTVTIQTPQGPYHVFFEVKRATKHDRADLRISVESAYPEDPQRGPPGVRGNMRIETLCTNTFLGRPISTKR
jgi:hypothetical protein